MFTLYPNNKIYNWSVGYSIRSTDLSLDGRYVNFSMRNVKSSPILKFEKKEDFVSVDIPNNLLQSHGVLQVYIYDVEHKYIEHKLEYFIYRRNKPDDYIYTETPVVEFAEISRYIEDTKKYINETKEDVIAIKDEFAESVDSIKSNVNQLQNDLDDALNQQIPESVIANAVSAYVTENSSGFVTQQALDDWIAENESNVYYPTYTFMNGMINENTGTIVRDSISSDASDLATFAVTNIAIPVFKGSYIICGDGIPTGTGSIYYYNAFDQFVGNKQNFSASPGKKIECKFTGKIRIVYNRKDGQNVTYNYLKGLSDKIKVVNQVKESFEYTIPKVNTEQRPFEILYDEFPSGGFNDGVIVNNQIYIFQSNSGSGSSASATLYIFDKYTGRLIETRKHGLTHMNSCDYNPISDKLIFGTNSSTESEDGSFDCYIYIYEHFSTVTNPKLDDENCKCITFKNKQACFPVWTQDGDRALFVTSSSKSGFDLDTQGIWWVDLSDISGDLKIIQKMNGYGLCQTQGMSYDGRLWVGQNWETLGATEIALDYDAGIYEIVKRYEYTYRTDNDIAAPTKFEPETVIRDGAYLYLAGVISTEPEQRVLGRMAVGQGGNIVDEAYVDNKLKNLNISATVNPNEFIWDDFSDDFKTALLNYVKSNIELQPIPCTGITLSTNNVKIAKDSTFTIQASKQPSNSTDAIVWTISPDNIATVKNGIVKANEVGTATITATCGNYSATCEFECYEYVSYSDESIDLCSLVGYVPLGDIDPDTHSIFIELDTTDGFTLPSSNVNIATTKMPNMSSGMGYFNVQHTTSNYMVLWDYNVDSTALEGGALSSQSRYQSFFNTTNGSKGLCAYNGNKYRMVWTDSIGSENIVTTKNTGDIAKYNKALYFNCSIGSNPDIRGLTSNEISEKLQDGTLRNASSKPFKVNKFIIFTNKSFDNYQDYIEHRSEADIDLRMDTNGNILNAGTSGEFVYARI